MHLSQVVAGESGGPAERIELEVVETILGWDAEPGYEVNAFFASDAAPLTDDDVERAQGRTPSAEKKARDKRGPENHQGVQAVRR